MIAAFNGKQAGKHVVHIACGSTYSAAITVDGELYTWGRGNYGRLGHGKLLLVMDCISALIQRHHVFCLFCLSKCAVLWFVLGSSEDQTTPMLVTALKGLKVVDVACGSGDAQTLAVTENGMKESVCTSDHRFCELLNS